MMDGTQVARIREGEEIELTVSPGEHTLQMRINWTGSPEVQFSVQSGESATFTCGGIQGDPLMSLVDSFFHHDRWVWLEPGPTDG